MSSTTLQSECKIRFSYLYDMINSISINRMALERMEDETDINENIVDYLPTSEEYVILNDLANLIFPMKQFIKALSSQNYPSLSLIFPMYHALAHGDAIQGIKIVNANVNALKECLIRNIIWRFDYVENSSFLKAATFLDYRYKNFSFIIGATGKRNCPRLTHIKEAITYLEG